MGDNNTKPWVLAKAFFPYLSEAHSRAIRKHRHTRLGFYEGPRSIAGAAWSVRCERCDIAIVQFLTLNDKGFYFLETAHG